MKTAPASVHFHLRKYIVNEILCFNFSHFQVKKLKNLIHLVLKNPVWYDKHHNKNLNNQVKDDM